MNTFVGIQKTWPQHQGRNWDDGESLQLFVFMLNALRKSQQVPSRGGATADESHVKVRKNLLKMDIFIALYCGIEK